MSRSKQLRSKLVSPLLDTTEDAEIQTAKDGPLLAVIGCGYWGAKHIRVSCDSQQLRAHDRLAPSTRSCRTSCLSEPVMRSSACRCWKGWLMANPSWRAG